MGRRGNLFVMLIAQITELRICAAGRPATDSCHDPAGEAMTAGPLRRPIAAMDVRPRCHRC